MGQEVAPPSGLIVRKTDDRTEIAAPRPTWPRTLALALAVVLTIVDFFVFGFVIAAVTGIAVMFLGIVVFERRLRPPNQISLTAGELTLASGRDVALADIRHVDVEPSYVPGTTTRAFEVRVTLRATDETVGQYDTAEQAAYVRGTIANASRRS
jgi:hypothetical protein